MAVDGGLSDYVQALVYTNVNDVIFHLRVEGDRFRFLAINPAFTRATGLDEHQVIGRYIDEILPESSRHVVLAKLRQAIAERRTVRWEDVTEFPTGTRTGEMSVTPVIESSGHATQLVGTVCDVTELREQQRTISLYAEVMRSVQIGLTAWSVTDPADISTIRLAAANPEAMRMSGVDLEREIGKPILDIMPALAGAKLVKLIAEVARDGRTRELWPTRSLVDPAQIVSAKVFPLSAQAVGLAIEDVTATYVATHIHAGERHALEQLASGASTSKILTSIVTMIEELAPGTTASILLLDESGTSLRVGAAPGLPDAYNRAIDGAPISAKAGSCGTAAYRAQPVYVTDIRTDPLWEDYRDLAMMLDKRACWSTPILGNDGRVLGTFALYHEKPTLPDASVLELVLRATHVTSIVLERRRLDEQLGALAGRIEAVREDERTGIAREIHDQLGQSLTALKMDVAWLARRLPASGEIGTKLTEMSRLADDVIQSVRRISAELRPGILDDLGLAATIEWQAEEFGARTGIELAIRNELGDLELARNVSTAAFRILQEALTNIARHAQATHVDVSLRGDADTLTLEIADDGIGVPDAALRGSLGSLGLIGMRERAKRLGGECIVKRREPRGTLVAFTVPLCTPLERRTEADNQIGS